jgi:hypothetical protein
LLPVKLPNQKQKKEGDINAQEKLTKKTKLAQKPKYPKGIKRSTKSWQMD